MGFDPMMQAIAPEDLVRAIDRALKPGIRGVFNIAGPPPAPLSTIIRSIGNTPLPLFEPIARLTIGVAFGVGAADVPAAQLDFLKYVNMVDDTMARETLRFKPQLGFQETLQGLID
jgi:UDP-glucose 4-epimerase